MTGKRAGYIIIDEVSKISPEMFATLADYGQGKDAWVEHFEAKPGELNQRPEPEAGPPSVLSIEPNSPHYHPCYIRVGVRIDGVERNDIAYYNLSDRSYKTNRHTSHLAETIEPYWRYPASRQQRRAEERWKGRRV